MQLNPVVVLLRIFNYNMVKVVMGIFMPSERVYLIDLFKDPIIVSNDRLI